jgi:3-hydroxyisobutyrate dehydrogenase/2-hydroxy-3-oxopropionate reductase
MGKAAAGRLLEAGAELYVYDTVPKSVEALAVLGANPLHSPLEAAAAADIILMFLPGPAEVRQCVAGPQGILAGAGTGLIVVDHSTVDPGTSEDMSRRAAESGVDYIDAPVLGRPATIGNWTFPAGGPQAALDKCRSVLEMMGKHVIHVGPSGAGNRIKLLNQMMFGAINAMTAEMMAVSDAMGIAPKKLYDTIVKSRAGTVSNLFVELGARIAVDDDQNPTFSVSLLQKDIRLAVEMAREAGASPILGHTVEFINNLAKADGMGDLDTSAMWKCLRRFM